VSAPKIFVSAGEASGDLHASRLVEALRRRLPECRFAGFGGPRLAAAGMELREDLVESSVMGLWPVLASLGDILGTVARFVEELIRDPPDLLVIVDYPGLNLNLARLARARGVPVVSYICPQVWAWAPWRLRRVARRSDLLLVIVPFEEDLYRRVHSRVRYVGNPVFDHLAALDAAAEGEAPLAVPAGRRPFALLPGSRRQEVRDTLGAQLRVAAELAAEDPRLLPIVSCQRPALLGEIERAIAESPVAAEVVVGPAAPLQRAAELALVCSGTATLEQAWFGTPMVVMYPASEVERSLYRSFGVAPFFGLVNIFAGREVVPEVLFTPGEEEEVLRRARPLIAGEERERVCADLRRLREERFVPGAAERAAEEIERFLAGARAGSSPAALRSV